MPMKQPHDPHFKIYAHPSPAQTPWRGARVSTNHPAESDALAWAQRRGCPSDDLLQILSKVGESNRRLEIKSEDIAIGEEIDKGSFGSICRATHKGQTVVIKRVSEVSKHIRTAAAPCQP